MSDLALQGEASALQVIEGSVCNVRQSQACSSLRQCNHCLRHIDASWQPAGILLQYHHMLLVLILILLESSLAQEFASHLAWLPW